MTSTLKMRADFIDRYAGKFGIADSFDYAGLITTDYEKTDDLIARYIVEGQIKWPRGVPYISQYRRFDCDQQAD